MNPFDLNALGPLFAGFQKRMEDMKRAAAETRVTGEAGGGLVKVHMTCDFQVASIEIGPAAFEDRELLEDLIRAASNEALRKVREEVARQASQLAGGLPIPPGLLPPGLF